MEKKSVRKEALGGVLFLVSVLAVVFHPPMAGGEGKGAESGALSRVCLEDLYLELEKPAWPGAIEDRDSLGEKYLYCRSPWFPPMPGRPLVSAVTVDGGEFLGLYKGKDRRRRDLWRQVLLAEGWREEGGSALANARTGGSGAWVFTGDGSRLLVFDVGSSNKRLDLTLVVAFKEGREG